MDNNENDKTAEADIESGYFKESDGSISAKPDEKNQKLDDSSINAKSLEEAENIEESGIIKESEGIEEAGKAEEADSIKTDESKSENNSENNLESNAESSVENSIEKSDNQAAEPSEVHFEDDLPELVSAVPHLWQLGSIKEIGDYPRYAELRKLGLSVGEAYYAVNGAKEAERAAKNGENAQLDAGLSHLTAVAAAGNPPVRVMSELERKVIRATLGEDIGERELERLWRRVNS